LGQVLGYPPDAVDPTVSRFAFPVKHAVLCGKARGPLGGGTYLKPLADPALKTRIADGKKLGAVVKDALAISIIWDTACREPAADATAFVQHSHPDPCSLQNGCRDEPGHSSTHNNAAMVVEIHTIPVPQHLGRNRAPSLNIAAAQRNPASTNQPFTSTCFLPWR
jgi:hypothetical protein